MRKKYAGIFILSVLALTFFSTPLWAFDARTGEDLVVGIGETIEEDLFIAGDTVTIDGTVNGDVYAAGRSVHIRGSIRDGVTVAAERITITGAVGRGVKAVSGELNIEGTVEGDIIAAARNISIGGDAVVHGDIIVAGQKIILSAPVNGYALGAGSTIGLNNRVRGDAVFAVRELTLQEDARIGGNLFYISENEAVIFPGAVVQGETVQRVPEVRENLKKLIPFAIIAGVIGKILAFITMVIVGLVIVFLAPKVLYNFSDAVKKYPGHSAGWGALILFVTPIGIGLAFLTVFGISLAVLALLAYLMALYLSQVVTALVIGRLILGVRDAGVSRGTLFGAFVLGLFLIRLLRFIPGIGIFVWVAAAIFGLGALVVTPLKLLGKRP
jgi:cytoskeletal protein CcmA (bactofilin family)